MNKLIILILTLFLTVFIGFSQNNRSMQPDISKDKIVFVSEDINKSLQIFISDLEGKNVIQLTKEGFNVMPNFSPDGKEISFIRRIGDIFQIFKMNSDGSNQMQLTNHTSSCFAPKWSPNGKFIAFGSKNDGDTEIYVMTSDGKNETQLTNNFVDDDRPEWSPDGNEIYYGHSGLNREWNLYKINIDNRTIEQVVFEDSSSPAVSPDGKYILYDSKMNKKFGIHIVDNKGKITNLLTSAEHQYSGAEWSVDGSKIVYQSNESGNNEVYIMDKDGGQKKRLTFSKN
jgi:TolB protein